MDSNELNQMTVGASVKTKTADTTTTRQHQHQQEGKPSLPPSVVTPSHRTQPKWSNEELRHSSQATHRRYHVHTDRAAGFTSYPLGIALFAAWLLTVFAAFSFDVVLDVFQHQLMLCDPPAIPWPLLVCTNVGIHLFLIFLVVLLGRLTKRRFRFFMPFVGGDAFVVLQLAGYASVCVTAMVRAVLLSQRRERYGAYAVLGAFAVLGHLLLLWSLSFFQPPPSPNAVQPLSSSTARSVGMSRGWRERLATSPLREIAWIVLCGGVVVLSSTVAEYYPAYRFVNIVVIICFVLSSLATIQYIIVPQWLTRHFYHVLLPVVLQSPTMYVLQVFGNGLLFMTFYAELVLFNAQQDAMPSWHLCCGLMAVMAIGAHLVLVHQLHAWFVVEDEFVKKQGGPVVTTAAASSMFPGRKEANEDEAVTASASHPSPVTIGAGSGTAATLSQLQQQQLHSGEPQSMWTASHRSFSSSTRGEYKNEIGSYGPILPSLFSAGLCVILIGILYVSSTSGDHLSAYVRQGLTQSEALLVALLFVQPFITHLTGVFLYGSSYRIWQPFEGNPDFILLQGVGWLCYGLSIFFATLHLSEHGHDNFLLFLMAFLVLSQFFIHMSVVRFGRNCTAPSASSSVVSAAHGVSGVFVAGASNEETGTAIDDAGTSTIGDVPLSNDRESNRSLARSDMAMSEDTFSQQRTPFWARSSSETPKTSLPSGGITAGEAMPGRRDGVTGGNDTNNGLLPSLSHTSNTINSALFAAATGSSFGGVGDSNTPSGIHNSDSVRGSSLLLSSVMNGELLLSVVLIGVSLVLRVVVIAAAYVQNASTEMSTREEGSNVNSKVNSTLSSARFATAQIPVATIIAAATFFSLTATPVVQWSMRRHVQLLHPLSHIYVALATLGWGTYLLLLSRFLVLWGLLGMERVSVTSPITRVGLSCFLPSSDFSAWLRQSCDAVTVDAQGQYTTGTALTLTAAFEGAVEGFVWCFPFLCLLTGDLFQTHAFLCEAASKDRVQRAVVSTLALFHAQCNVSTHPGTSTATTNASTSNNPTLPAVHSRHSPEAQLVCLLRTVAGPRAAVVAAVDNSLTSEGGSGINSNSCTDPADLHAVHDAARYMTITLCFATGAAFFSAAFLADAQPIMTLGFGAVGTVTLGLSCIALHYIYGTRVHSGTRAVDKPGFSQRVPVYIFFMPFVGGSTFVVLQSVGWISYTCVASLMIACALEGKGTATIFVVMAALSFTAQVALWRSVGCFDESKVFERGFLQRNAEGFLAAISVVATVSFSRLYDMAEQGRATAHLMSSMVPVVVCSIAVCLAVPLGLISLQRQAELYGLGSFAAWFAADDDDDEDGYADADADAGADGEEAGEAETCAMEEAEGTSRPHRRTSSTWLSASDSATGSPLSRDVSSPGMPHSIYSRTSTETSFSPLLGTPGVVHRRTWATAARRSSTRCRSLAAVIFYLLSTVLAILVIVVLPFALVFLGYVYYTQQATVTYGLAVRVVEALLCCFTALVVLPMLVVPVLGCSSTLRNVHSAFCCWALYNIPTYTFLGGISTPFIYKCRGTYLFTINMCSMALLSNLPYMPIAMSIFSVSSFVYFLKYHFYDGLYAHKHELETMQCVVDLTIAVFWVCYQRRYHGRPEITGRLQSRRATRFFQQYFFRGFAYYFSMRVIVGDGYVLPIEEPYITDPTELPRVDLSKPDNQYMFSFHPHGVFPGTSMVVPKTEIWEKAVGRCSGHFVSTHCADIVFNVPLMREFPLCLGAMSVSRRGIEGSLRQGNSPLIVTGGQSEMLLTRMTDYEMHLVCHHIGFIRIALKNRVPLVPVISFSESNILDNVHCIRIQRWFLNRIAFPFPTMPIGRWHLPLPTTKPVTIVVGQPISPLPGHDNPEDPAHIEELRLRYFEHLEVLFYKYRAEAGYPEMELYLHNGIYNPGVRGTTSVAAPLMRGSAQRQSKSNLSVEMFDSAVRRAFSMPLEEKPLSFTGSKAKERSTAAATWAAATTATE